MNTGLGQMDDLGAMDDLAERATARDGWPFDLVLPFDATIAVNSSQVSAQRNDTGYYLRVDAITGYFFSPAALASLPAGTMYPWDDGYTGGNMPGLGMLEAQLTIGDTQWSSAPVPLNALIGDARRPYYLTRRPVLAPGVTVQAIVYNRNSATYTARGRIVLKCIRIPVR